MSYATREEKIERMRELGTYEHWRANFTHWVLENRTNSWIAGRTNLSMNTVRIIIAALDLTGRRRVKMSVYDTTTFSQQRESDELIRVIREYSPNRNRGWWSQTSQRC